MSLRALVIEPEAIPPESSCQSVLGGLLNYERQAWEWVRPEEILCHPVELLIPHVVSETPKTLSFFRWLRDSTTCVPTLAILPESSSLELLTATEVADDLVFWPVRGQELEVRIQRLVHAQSGVSPIEADLAKEMSLAKLVGRHPSILRAAQQAVLFAASNAPVLITGETGTGKELFAHATHSLSKRKNGPFIPVDCGALPEHLAENELFGHCRGAFTDAHRDQRGLAAMADDGTLFLDEVDALSPANQGKLLRLLQEGTYRALGADRFTRANARVIAASNRNLEERVEQGLFRSDLYFRLNVLRLHLPALRERREDISLLARHFLESECAAHERRWFSPAAMRKLENHPWPGNARELFNAVQRATVCCKGHLILPEDIVLSGETRAEAVIAANESFRRARQHAIEQFERGYVERLLTQHAGNVTQAARAAEKERRSFGKLVKKYNLGSRPQSNA